VQPCRILEIAEGGDPIGEEDHRHRRGHRKAEPCCKAARQPRPQDAEADPGLARRRTRQELAERDDVGIGALVEPFAALDELGPVIAEMRDGAPE
jgi:hypothetical protein